MEVEVEILTERYFCQILKGCNLTTQKFYWLHFILSKTGDKCNSVTAGRKYNYDYYKRLKLAV